jgi:hypothetical protein
MEMWPLLRRDRRNFSLAPRATFFARRPFDMRTGNAKFWKRPRLWGEGGPLHPRPLVAGGAERRIGKDGGAEVELPRGSGCSLSPTEIPLRAE